MIVWLIDLFIYFKLTHYSIVYSLPHHSEELPVSKLFGRNVDYFEMAVASRQTGRLKQ